MDYQEAIRRLVKNGLQPTWHPEDGAGNEVRFENARTKRNKGTHAKGQHRQPKWLPYISALGLETKEATDRIRRDIRDALKRNGRLK